MRIKAALRIAAVGTIVALSSLAARAEAPEDDSALRQNCVGDYFRFCARFMPGSPAIRQCFAANIGQLTPECRGAIQAFDRRNPKGH